MDRRVASVWILLVSVALAGCAERTVDKDAVVRYLNGPTAELAAGCPFPVDARAGEGIAGQPDARAFQVLPDARVLAFEPDRTVVLDRNLSQVGTRRFDGTAPSVRSAQGPDLHVLARDDGSTWTLSTWTLQGVRLAERTWNGTLVDVAVDREGRVHAAGPDRHVTLDRNLTLLTDDPAPTSGTVHSLSACSDRLLWLASPAAASGWTVQTTALEGSRLDELASGDGSPAALAAGHGLAFVTYEQGGTPHLGVWTMDGTHLLTREGERPFGTFAVAHGHVYNLRGSEDKRALLVRPLPDFLTRPA